MAQFPSNRVVRKYLKIRHLVVLIALALPLSGWAYPMRPDLKVLIQHISRPQVKYPLARAGWNGPEEKTPQNSPNPFYDQLRRQETAADRAHLFIQAATPDWRIVLGLTLLIALMRVGFFSVKRKPAADSAKASTAAFPSPPAASLTENSQQAA